MPGNGIKCIVGKCPDMTADIPVPVCAQSAAFAAFLSYAAGKIGGKKKVTAMLAGLVRLLQTACDQQAVVCLWVDI